MIKVGLLGFGFMGVTHYQIYQNLPHVQVTGIFDVDPEKVQRGEIAAGNIGDGGGKPDLAGVKVTGKAEELINAADIDIIDICLPTFVHAEVAVKALNAGRHVFCEKPMALDPGECDRMLGARDKSRKNLMIGHCVRFWPEYALTRQLIREKRYGEVNSAFFRRLSPTPSWSYGNWLLREEKSGGALLDLHIHDIDYILNVFGQVSGVSSFAKQNAVSDQSGVDYVLTRYATESPALIVAEGGWHFNAPFPFNMSFHISCERATLEFDAGREKTLAVHTGEGRTEYPSHSNATGWEEELKYFVNCVMEGKSVDLSPPEESKTAVEIALMERDAIRTRKPVAFA